MPVETPIKLEADFGDQSGIFDPKKFTGNLTVIGCGGIGASALPTLATLGIRRIEIWDPDFVEPRNVASQLMFRPGDIGQPKVEVAKEILHAYGVEEVVAHQEYFQGADHASMLDGVVITAVDSMSARQQIWDGIKLNPMVSTLIDGRIGGESYTLIVIDPLNYDQVCWYEQFQLFDDDQAAPLPCTERAVVYPAVELGAKMAVALANLQRGLPVPSFTHHNMNGVDYLTQM